VVRILRILFSGSTDERSPDAHPLLRAQSNVDFVIALFILLVFFSGVLFTPGSPLLEAAQSGTDDQIDAQLIATELTSEVGESDGQLNTAQIEAIVDDDHPDSIEDYTSAPDNLGVNITLFDSTYERETNASVVQDTGFRQGGDALPATETSTAVKTVRIDNRPVTLEIIVWREA